MINKDFEAYLWAKSTAKSIKSSQHFGCVCARRVQRENSSTLKFEIRVQNYVALANLISQLSKQMGSRFVFVLIFLCVGFLTSVLCTDQDARVCVSVCVSDINVASHYASHMLHLLKYMQFINTNQNGQCNFILHG